MGNKWCYWGSCYILESCFILFRIPERVSHLHFETQANNIKYILELSTPLACKDNYCGLMEIFANMTGNQLSVT